jgi:hypothetical protein
MPRETLAIRPQFIPVRLLLSIINIAADQIDAPATGFADVCVLTPIAIHATNPSKKSRARNRASHPLVIERASAKSLSASW